MKITVALIATLIFSLTFSQLQAQRVVVRTSHNKVVVNKRTKVERVTKLPKQHKVVVHKRVNYYYFDGYYHTHANGTYTRVVAPTGLIVTAFPAGAKRVVHKNKVYYTKNGVVYKRIAPSKYKVVVV